MENNLNITPEMVDNLINMFQNSNNNSSEDADKNGHSSEPQQSNPFGDLDFETIMKIKSVLDSFNSKNDKDTNLLYSLKPYLRKSRQDKIDQYINILKISQVSKLFRNGNGDMQ